MQPPSLPPFPLFGECSRGRKNPRALNCLAKYPDAHRAPVLGDNRLYDALKKKPPHGPHDRANGATVTQE